MSWDNADKTPIHMTFCLFCKELKVQSEYKCPGCDECIYGLDGKAALPCEGWGSYCCRCGADFARSQI